eukprot:RCo023927
MARLKVPRKVHRKRGRAHAEPEVDSADESGSESPASDSGPAQRRSPVGPKGGRQAEQRGEEVAGQQEWNSRHPVAVRVDCGALLHSALRPLYPELAELRYLKTKGFGFARFSSVEAAEEAIREGPKQLLGATVKMLPKSESQGPFGHAFASIQGFTLLSTLLKEATHAEGAFVKGRNNTGVLVFLPTVAAAEELLRAGQVTVLGQ